MPIVALVFMYKAYIKESIDNKYKQFFLILCQGLNKKHFYWEFVNSARKMSLLIALILPDQYKIASAVFLLILTWRLQIYLQPYKDVQNNSLEILGVNIAVVTICCGLIYNQGEIEKSMNTLLIILIVIMNIAFVLNWVQKMLEIFKNKSRLVELVQLWNKFRSIIFSQ